MKRVEFSRKIRALSFAKCKGYCEACRAKLKPCEAEYDHITPLALGGDSSLDNCQVICKVCHKSKSADDVRRIRKADRQRDKNSGAIRPKGEIKSAGFAKKATT
ncbi:HNH endonuclease [Rhizobium alvei]